MRLYKVFSRELGLYPVKIIWNALFGSKEARYQDPPDILNFDGITGPYTNIFRNDFETLGE
jgi:hypothetical protein